MFRFIISIFILILVSGCAGQANKSIEVNENSDMSLVIVGVDISDNYGETALSFRRYSPESGLPVGGATIVKNKLAWVGPTTPLQYLAFTLEPGKWFLPSSLTTKPYNQIYAGYPSGTISFDVSPGQAIYLGNLKLTSGGSLVLTSPDIEAAKEKLLEYKNVVPNLKYVKPDFVKFTCDPDAKTLIGLKARTCLPIDIVAH